jgi:hypothetical protein
MSETDQFIAAIEQRTGRQGRRQGRHIRLLCPVHDDHEPSLDVAESADGRPLVQCRSHGCSYQAIREAIGWESRRSGDDGWTPKGPAIAVYPYVDESGVLLSQVCRTADKQFLQRRPDGVGGWLWNLNDTRRVLYRLPKVIAAVAAGEPVYIVEGEKDVHALERLDVVATCNPMGAGKWRKEFAEVFRGAHVVLVQDRDDEGRAHADKVMASLEGVVKSVRRIEAATGKDAADHVAAGGTLQSFVDGGRPAEPKEVQLQLGPGTREYGRLLRQSLAGVRSRSVRHLVPGLLPLSTFTLIAGVGGLGKSTWLAKIAADESAGRLLGGEPHDVIVISYEDTAEEIWRPRILAAGGDVNRVHEVTVSLDDGGVVVLPDDLADLERLVRDLGSRFVVVDPIIASIDLNYDAHKDQHVRSVLGKLVAMARSTGCAVAGLGHLNKAPSKDAYIRIANSVAFWNAARSVVLITEDGQDDEEEGNDDLRLISQVKANWSRLKAVQRHRIDEVVLPDELDLETGLPVVVSRMTFVEDLVDFDVSEVLDQKKTNADEKSTRAVVFLVQALADGDWHDSSGLKALAGAQQIKERTLKRAAHELDVEHERRGFPSTTHWRLSSRAKETPSFPGSDGPTRETAQPSQNGTLSVPVGPPPSGEPELARPDVSASEPERGGQGRLHSNDAKSQWYVVEEVADVLEFEADGNGVLALRCPTCGVDKEVDKIRAGITYLACGHHVFVEAGR